MLFISYSSKDGEAAQKVVSFLEEKGIRCWISSRDIVSGTSYASQIVNAVRQCTGFILIASNNSNQSNHIVSEVSEAFDLKKPIYPFLIDQVTFSDVYIYYLRQFQWINAYDDFGKGLDVLYSVIRKRTEDTASAEKDKTREGFETGLKSLLGKIKKTEPAKEAKGSREEGGEVRIVTYQELTAMGMTALDIARRLVENDYNLYPGMVVENEGEPEQWAGYLSAYPDTFRYLINDRNEIIGNWSFLAVSEELHAEKLASGQLTENMFRLDETEYLMFPGDYTGYLLDLSVNIGYNNPRNINLLIEAFVDQMIVFAEEGIFFKSWYVNVFRKDHEAMYRRMGFSYLLDNVSFGKVYHLSCIPLAREPQRKSHSTGPVYAKSKKLMELYYDHFVQDA